MTREHLDGTRVRGLSGGAGGARATATPGLCPRPGCRGVDIPDDGGGVAGTAHYVVPVVVQAQTRDYVHVPDDLAHRLDFGHAKHLGRRQKCVKNRSVEPFECESLT